MAETLTQEKVTVILFVWVHVTSYSVYGDDYGDGDGYLLHFHELCAFRRGHSNLKNVRN